MYVCVCEVKKEHIDFQNVWNCLFQYTCLECKLFDDEDKNQYHCEGCGICRIGGRDKFFHCEKCNMCLPVKLQNGHRVSKSK